MAIIRSESFSVAGGVTLTTANTDFDYVSGAPPAAAGGVVDTCMSCTGTAGPHGQFYLAGTTGTMYSRFYVKLGATGTVFYMSQLFATATQIATLSVQSGGGLRMRQGTSVTLGDTESAFKLSTTEWTRVEWMVTPTHQQVKMFQGANMHGSVPDHDSGAIAWTANTFNRTGVGNTIAAGASLLVDEYAVGDDWIGTAVVETVTPPWQRKTAGGWQRMKTVLI